MSLKLPIDISTLGKDGFQEWLDSFDVVLSDCDGVLWLHDYLFEGSNDVINKFVEIGKKVYLVTNNNQTTPAEMAIKCKKLNFDLGLESMISSSDATARYMKHIGFDKKAYVIGTKAVHDQLNSVGIETLGLGPENTTQSLVDQVKYELSRMDKEVAAVVIGFDDHFSFAKLFKATNYLKDPSVAFIATNNDQSMDFPKFRFPEAGPIIAAVENATGRKATIVGKPSKLLVEVTLNHESHRDRNRFLMIGDRLNTDILFGNRNNFQTLMVGTGVHQLKDVQDAIDKVEMGEGDENTAQLVPQYYISALKHLFDQA